MMDGSLMTKKRPWGRIEESLEPGTYTVTAENNYMISEMEISKGIQVSTAGPMGGFNLFFPVAFIIAAISCFAYAILIHCKLSSYE